MGVEAQTEPPERPISSEAPRYAGALAGVAKRYEEIRGEDTLDLQVPGYEGRMKVQYRLLPEAEMDRLADRIEEKSRGASGVSASLDIEADMLVSMCDRILVRDPDDEVPEWVPLEDETGPVRFEARFAAILRMTGIKVSDRRAAEVVLDFFSPRKNQDDPSSPRRHPQAIEAHTNALILWHRGQKESISRRLLGE